MVAPPKHAEGALIWVPCEESVWKPAEVLRSDEKSITIHSEGLDGVLQEQVLTHDVPVHIRNADLYSAEGLQGLDDLTQLTHLHEPAVLHSLNLRFDVDTIYTYTGPILIAVNPFKTIPSLYDESKLKFFLSNPQPRSGNRVPHVFSSAELAYRGMVENKCKQTILISGESGAGKTESTKFVMRLLALAGSPDWDNRSQIENQVLQSNPLLEAFGNAKTLRNDNSSRFGKFIDMQFNVGFDKAHNKESGRLVGARIETYLLETVRCCHQLEGERNYHSFYQGCAASLSSGCNKSTMVYKFPSILRAKLPEVEPIDIDLSGFSRSHDFKYMTESTCHVLPRMDDLEEFELTVNAMLDIGISPEEINDIYRITGAVLRIGNVEFNEEDKEEAKVNQTSNENIKIISRLLGLDAADLEKCLCNRTLRASTDVYLKPLNFESAEDTRDSLARALYNCMFKQVVQKTNMSIGFDESVKLSCGVLDIFGFECFDYNSFEQLCINFTNERLQQFFNTFIFKEEERLYEAEQIEWSALDFPDNQDCVDLLQKRPWGVMCMLDEECLVPQGTNQAFCNKVKEKHKGNVRFDLIKTKPDWFIVNHFAGGVGYCSDGFLEKNKDTLSEDVINCVKSSNKSLIANLFVEFLTSTKDASVGKKKLKMTVSLEFRNQLQVLMDTVNQTEPHFIRCIKPNVKNKPDLFERSAVCEQLRYGGVLQAVQVSRAGFPVRTGHREAVLDYRMLADKKCRDSVDAALLEGNTKEAAKTLFSHLDVKFEVPKPKHAVASWSVGLSMVFFKHESYEIFAAQTAKIRSSAAECIQACWKGRQQRIFYTTMRSYTITIQACTRGFIVRKRVHELRRQKAAIKIQAMCRMHFERQRFLKKRNCIVMIQKWIRGHLSRLATDKKKKEMARQRLKIAIVTYTTRQTFEAAYSLQLMKREQDEAYQLEIEAERKQIEEEQRIQKEEELKRQQEEVARMKEEHEKQREDMELLRLETVAQAQREAEEEMKRLKDEMAAFREEQLNEKKASPVDSTVVELYEEKIRSLEQERDTLQDKLESSERELALLRDEIKEMRQGTPSTAETHGQSLTPSPTLDRHSEGSRSRPGQTVAKPSISNFIRNGMNNLFGEKVPRNAGVPLSSSLMATIDMKEDVSPSAYESGEIRPYEEVNDIDSAVTYICFGQQTKHRDYILLAAGGKDGSVVVYRCYRTDSEIRDFVAREEGERNVPFEQSSKQSSNPPKPFQVHNFMNGHNKAITSIFFTVNEDNLVTTSVDRTVRFWSVETGDMLKVFSDSSPALVALFLPFNPALFVAANSNSILRVVNIQNGHVLQKLKFDSEVRAMKFDNQGMHLVAGTKSGIIHVLEAAEATQLKFRFKIGLSRAAITHITFIPQRGEEPAQIAVNSCDSTLSIMDCLYSPHGSMTHLVVKHRLKIPQSLLPLRSCYSGHGNGWLMSASEDRHVYVFSLSKKKEYPVQLLKHHKYPVLTVAVNEADTILASADTCGKIVLWRRYDFSHLSPSTTLQSDVK
eukprot:GHVH01007264.1.p1 GENE.GHVH01007264.1~~GHVH01007264.1.p1  ORF type:complete len:1519 (+),score=224.86 GHVH01007264.1:273-4829(+)